MRWCYYDFCPTNCVFSIPKRWRWDRPKTKQMDTNFIPLKIMRHSVLYALLKFDLFNYIILHSIFPTKCQQSSASFQRKTLMFLFCFFYSFILFLSYSVSWEDLTVFMRFLIIFPSFVAKIFQRWLDGLYWNYMYQMWWRKHLDILFLFIFWKVNFPSAASCLGTKTRSPYSVHVTMIF